MTTNQTIDGVSRRMLPCPFCGSSDVSLAWDVYDTDRGRRTQSQIRCLGCRILTKTFKSHAEARAYWNNRAAQPQGEPVAWQYRVSAGPQTGWSLWGPGKGEEYAEHYTVETRPLYAEQPAPVAVLPERLGQVLKFLDGAENLDGHWFGEPHPSGHPYWWRNELRKALAETNLFAKQQ